MELNGTPGYGLMPRDINVLRDLGRMRYLQTGQIERLHFPSRRVANRRLEVLTENAFTDRFRLPMLIGQGSSEFVYCLENKGGELLSALDGGHANLQVPQRYGRPKNFPLMEHLLAINDFWITLEAACQTSGLSIATFIPEYYGARSENNGFQRLIADSTPSLDDPAKSLCFVPDAAFLLERNARKALFFLEIDRGTEKVTSTRYAAFQNKAKAYTSYYLHGGFKRWGAELSGFRVLILTTSDQRRKNLLSTAIAGYEQLMWFSTATDVTIDSLFGAVWHVQGRSGAQALIRE